MIEWIIGMVVVGIPLVIEYSEDRYARKIEYVKMWAFVSGLILLWPLAAGLMLYALLKKKNSE